MNHKLESRLLGEIPTTTDTDDTILIAESEKELKSLLMSVKGDREKAYLKLHSQKTKIMASGPIASQQIGGKKSENSDRFYFLGLQSHCG